MSDKSEVSKWILDNEEKKMYVMEMSKDDTDVHLFKVCVNTLLSIDLWPEYVGYRPFLKL